ncbi:DUF4173 domain-containing protein [Actinoplanes sp. TBRC 11911]|nr:DUF4173 domain-containing protein [Actinoplanes sp. TBRC 11911]
MPPTPAIPSMVWPGRAGEPAWAIPVQIAPGTQGYAVFLPMVPVPQQAPAATTPKPAEATSKPTEDATSKPAEGATSKPAEAGDAKPAKPVATTPANPVATTPANPVAARPADASGDGATTVPAQANGGAATFPVPAPTNGGATAVPAAGARPPRPWEDRGAAAIHIPPPVTIGIAGPYRPAPTPWQTWRDKHWRGPSAAKGRAVPAAVLTGALGLAIFVPLTRSGIGWFLGWLVLVAGIVAAVRRTAVLERSERWTRIGFAAAALALLAIPAFRNAWWLVTFSVLGALGCSALAVVGGRGIRSILFSAVAVPYAAVRGLPWVRNHLHATHNPGIARRVGFSIGLTLLVLLIFGGLLSSADVAFSTLLGRAVPDLDGGSVFSWIFLAVMGALIAVAGTYTLSAPPTTSSLDTDGRRRFGLVEWAPATSALMLLFVGFVVVQFAVLFGGRRHVLTTSGLSYAQYARSGFWQLVAVTLLTVAVLGAVARWARRDRPIERLLLRILLGLLCGLSVVIVASALSRMWTYQKVYSFTGERIFVMSFELLLGVVFVMIAAAGVRWRGRWIPRATVGLTVLMLLGLAVLDPENYAADRNIVRYEQAGKIDAWYLRALSADATPALTRLPDPVRRCTLSWIADDLAKPDPWYAWNLGRSQARKALADLGPNAVGNHADCRAADQFDLPKTRR